MAGVGCGRERAVIQVGAWSASVEVSSARAVRSAAFHTTDWTAEGAPLIWLPDATTGRGALVFLPPWDGAGSNPRLRATQLHPRRRADCSFIGQADLDPALELDQMELLIPSGRRMPGSCCLREAALLRQAWQPGRLEPRGWASTEWYTGVHAVARTRRVEIDWPAPRPYLGGVPSGSPVELEARGALLHRRRLYLLWGLPGGGSVGWEGGTSLAGFTAPRRVDAQFRLLSPGFGPRPFTRFQDGPEVDRMMAACRVSPRVLAL
jgi:hypothetical protein